MSVGDWEAYRAAFADEGVDVVYTDGRPFSANEEKAEARFAHNVALGLRQVVESCSVISKDSVTCTVLTSDDVMEALGAEPVVETHEYRISDGLLVFRGLDGGADSPQILQAFQEWAVETNHPAVELSIEFHRRPVLNDVPVLAAAELEAVDEFLAQYEG